jgi:pilus assembly protein CpaC
MIDALAQDGLITILAEPNLTAMSGETANFLAGGEFPIPVPQGNGTISIEFKPYGISLAFTPTLISENRINLHVRPEVSELTQVGAIILDNITVPALTTRKAETTVELGSGESFAIAGLLDNKQAQTVNKFPILGDMPVLGALFRSDHFQNGQTELIVVITPYIVKPSGEQLALPVDNYAIPNETERLVGLRYSSSDPNARPVSGDARAKFVPEAAAPQAAPVAAVTGAPLVVAPTTPTAAPVKLAPVRAPASLRPEGDAAQGQGGFQLE